MRYSPCAASTAEVPSNPDVHTVGPRRVPTSRIDVGFCIAGPTDTGPVDGQNDSKPSVDRQTGSGPPSCSTLRRTHRSLRREPRVKLHEGCPLPQLNGFTQVVAVVGEAEGQAACAAAHEHHRTDHNQVQEPRDTGKREGQRCGSGRCRTAPRRHRLRFPCQPRRPASPCQGRRRSGGPARRPGHTERHSSYSRQTRSRTRRRTPGKTDSR